MNSQTDLKHNYSNILLIIVAGIGDFLESINAIKTIRDSNPQTSISLLVSSKVYDYAKECPFVNNVYSFPVSKGKGYNFYNLGTIIRIFRGLRSKSFQVALNLFEVSTWGGAVRMALLLKIIGAKYSIGRNSDGKGFIFSKSIEDNTDDIFNQAHYFDRLAKLLSGDKNISKTTMPWISDGDKASVDSLLLSWGFKATDNILLINPASDRLTRRWPKEYFVKVIEHFAIKYSFKPVIVGSFDEQSIADEIRRLSSVSVYSAAGKVKIGGLISLIRRSKIAFTTNSASMHIAGICGVPFVAPAGSGNPWRDKPSGEENKMILLWKKIDCNPCSYWKCPKSNYMECMNIISPEEAIRAGEHLLKAPLQYYKIRTNKSRVLVTGARQRTALYVIRSLGIRGFEITAVEAHLSKWLNLGFASKYVKNRIIMPNVISEPEAHRKKLLELCKEHDVLLPITMYSLKLVSEHLDEFKKVIKVAVADVDTLNRANNTETALRLANECDIPTPKTYFIENLDQVKELKGILNYPVFIKVKEELALAPFQRHIKVSNAGELLDKYRQIHNMQPFPMIQEFIEGRGMGYFALFDKNSHPKAVFGHRRIREYPVDNGPSTCCESYRDPKVMEYGEKLLKKLNWYGLAMVEFKMDIKDNMPKLMEINPRVWGSMPLAIESGIDFPYLWYKLAMEEEIPQTTSFKEGVKLRFFLNDMQAALSSLTKINKTREYFLGFIKDIFDFKIKDGIIKLYDIKPGIIYFGKAISFLFRLQGKHEHDV
ncbi:MAG: ATP-grasp domain-containing protein [Elusimicrobia bacterium]|nr:ATP-grasp domain-containing protein [Candidatus Liberimonas magnetica]